MAGTASAVQDDSSGSVFQSDLPVDAKDERARAELLDLSARNRLLNIPRSAKSVKSPKIVDEKASEVFRMLLRDGKAFTFLPGRVSWTKAEPDVPDFRRLRPSRMK